MRTSDPLHLTISQPCQQSWYDMTPDETGKFCNSCKKTVVDFTSLSDQEVLALISRSTAKLCGRFHVSQLNRPLLYPQKQHQTNFIPAVVLSTTLLAGLAAEGNAQVVNPAMQMVQTPAGNLADATMEQVGPAEKADTLYRVTGKILSADTKETVGGATVRIKNTNYGVAADQYGNFNLKIPDSLAGKDITLVIAAIGFLHQELLVCDSGYLQPKEILIEVNNVVLGGAHVIITRSAQPPTLWQKVKRFFKRTF